MVDFLRLARAFELVEHELVIGMADAGLLPSRRRLSLARRRLRPSGDLVGRAVVSWPCDVTYLEATMAMKTRTVTTASLAALMLAPLLAQSAGLTDEQVAAAIGAAKQPGWSSMFVEAKGRFGADYSVLLQGPVGRTMDLAREAFESYKPMGTSDVSARNQRPRGDVHCADAHRSQRTWHQELRDHATRSDVAGCSDPTSSPPTERR